MTAQPAMTGASGAGRHEDHQVAGPDPIGDRTEMILAAIAKEVAYRDEQGLPVYVDHGKGIRDVRRTAART